MNKVMLIGRLTKDVDFKHSANDKGVARFTLAIPRPFKKDEADFINCIAFGKTAEIIAQYISKGQQIAIEGTIRTGSYEKNGQKIYTTDVIVDKSHFLGTGANHKSINPSPKNEEELPNILGDEELGLDEDNLPF